MANQSENTVTIYANGLAAFERTYEVGDKDVKKLSLPFKKDVIGDVAATLSILGDVEVVEAPNYSPNKEKPALELDPAKLTAELFTKLAGAKVTIQKTGQNAGELKGRVAGYQTENNVLAGNLQSQQHFVTVQKEDGSFERLNFGADVAGFTFTDDTIQSLITKALDWNVERINPESVYLTMGLKGSKPTKACIKYVIPSPAYKLTYRAKQNGKGKWTLFGYAVVDNNTDEDWNNFNVNCATGQPITFATDISELRIPKRQKVNLVNETAMGAVEVESGAEMALACAAGGTEESMSKSRGAGPASARRMAAPAPAMAFNASDAPEAGQRMAVAVEIGDTSFFRGSEPVTIPAKKSGLVKVIEQKLPDAMFCLYHQASKGIPIMRALKLTNGATYTLGRGCCSIEQEGAHMGSAVLSMTKPTETAMLCHAQETGVRPLIEEGQERSKCMKHQLAEGMLVTEWCKNRTTVYTYRNVKDETFTLKLDHQCQYQGGEVNCEGGDFDTKLTGNVCRYTVSLPTKGNNPVSVTTVTLHEHVVTHSTVKAGEFLDWIVRNPDSPLLKAGALQTIVGLYKQWCATNQEITTTDAKLTALKAEQVRVRQNCETLERAAKTDNNEAKQNLSKAASRLMSCEQEIVTIENTTLSALHEKKGTLARQIREAAATCTAGWTAPDGDSDDAGKPIRKATTVS